VTEQNSIMLKELSNKMQDTIKSCNKFLSSLRTGKASVFFLDPIRVDAYGSAMTINQIASVTTPNPKVLVIQVWDKELVPNVKKAILKSDLGLTPNVDGQILKLNIPSPSEERRKTLVKKANQYAVQAKMSVRNTRRYGIDLLKKQIKDKCISEDELKNYSQEIQKLTDNFISQISDMLEKKSKDIMNI